MDVNRKAFERVRSCAEAFIITAGDLRGPVLTRLGQEHRRQETRVFASEGAEGASGRWPRLSPDYAARKRRAVGNRRILVYSGDMKERFVRPTRSEYIQDFQAQGKTGGVFRFGARSEIAVHHFEGADETRRSKRGRVFRWVLPKRDMVTKTQDQVLALRERLVRWYREERLPQVARVCARHAALSKGELRRAR